MTIQELLEMKRFLEEVEARRKQYIESGLRKDFRAILQQIANEIDQTNESEKTI